MPDPVMAILPEHAPEASGRLAICQVRDCYRPPTRKAGGSAVLIGRCSRLCCTGPFVKALRSGIMPKGCPQAGADTFEPDCPEEEQ